MSDFHGYYRFITYFTKNVRKSSFFFFTCTLLRSKPVSLSIKAITYRLGSIVERYLDNQSIEEISRSLRISTTDVETSVKRVIREWKKTAK